MNLLPQLSVLLHVCPQLMTAALIPVYHADGSLYTWASEERLARLQSAGLVARVVRQRKGRINRAILFMRPGELKPLSRSSLMGTKYAFKELLEHGWVWQLKHLSAPSTAQRNRTALSELPATAETHSTGS
ncbi:MAG: hypothetical protein NTY38_12110 [Acidobacteria bacterium]|nr:hypothetical protein [Acidobacteriota bacterium]